jgi:nicotinamide-nucleotide amidase
VRLWNTPESELAATLREHETRLAGLEITTCLRAGELEVVTRFPPAGQPAYDELARVLTTTYPDTVFSTDGRTVDELVADALVAGGATIATAESCTGGLLAARLTELPGSSRYVIGGVTAYSDQLKQDLLGVPAELIQRHGAVSAEVAEAMARGVRGTTGASIGVGITGIAGPDGGTPDKPVGLVHLGVTSAQTTLLRQHRLPGSRRDVRARAVVIAMHLIRKLLGDLTE